MTNGMTTTDRLLGVHVFGGTIGESIALQLPSGAWGIVDSYASDSTDPKSNPALRYLDESQVRDLDFVCLTHPHSDHFRGMLQFFKQFNVRAFWYSNALTPPRLKQIAMLDHVLGEQTGRKDKKSAARELESLFAYLHSHKSQIMTKRLSLGTQVYPHPLGAPTEVRITALAPSARQCERYETALGRCFDANGNWKTSLTDADHNLISAALLVEFGDTRVVLGGDVEQQGWENCLEEIERRTLSATCVKVSHHGSTTGYSDELWPTIAKAGRPIAIVTSYFSKRLPSEDGLKHVSAHCSDLVSTNRSTLPTTLSAAEPVRLPLESVTKLGHYLKVRKANESFGRCSIWFNSAGQVVRREITEPATLVKPATGSRARRS